jgi:hypothetical protein
MPATLSLVPHLDREARLDAEGWKVVHVTWKELFGDEAGLIARVRRAFGEGARLEGEGARLEGEGARLEGTARFRYGRPGVYGA